MATALVFSIQTPPTSFYLVTSAMLVMQLQLQLRSSPHRCSPPKVNARACLSTRGTRCGKPRSRHPKGSRSRGALHQSVQQLSSTTRSCGSTHQSALRSFSMTSLATVKRVMATTFRRRFLRRHTMLLLHMQCLRCKQWFMLHHHHHHHPQPLR